MECTYCGAEVARSYETAASEAYAKHPDTRSTLHTAYRRLEEVA